MAKTKLLIASDEMELSENLADLLEFEGYEVETCSSGEEVLEKVASATPDAVLVSMYFTGSDGINILHKIKESKPSLPVVMLSPLTEKQTRDRLAEEGADGLVFEPYEIDEVLSEIGLALGKSKAASDEWALY